MGKYLSKSRKEPLILLIHPYFLTLLCTIRQPSPHTYSSPRYTSLPPYAHSFTQIGMLGSPLAQHTIEPLTSPLTARHTASYKHPYFPPLLPSPVPGLSWPIRISHSHLQTFSLYRPSFYIRSLLPCTEILPTQFIPSFIK